MKGRTGLFLLCGRSLFLCLLLERYGKSKNGARTRLTLRSDVSTHQIHQLFTNGEPQTRPSIFPGGGTVGLDEWLE